MANRLRKQITWGAALIIIVTISFIACSDNNIMGPETDQSFILDSGLAKGPGTQGGDAAPDDPGTPPSFPGAFVPINFDGHSHYFEIQQDGLTLIKTIVLRIRVGYQYVMGSRAMVFDFGPDGLVFDKPAKLGIDFDAINTAAAEGNLYYFDPDLRDWVLFEKKPIRNGFVEFDINHFSKYAIAD